jgi:pimeloyl-ACP methyl ester carboxylesterase
MVGEITNCPMYYIAAENDSVTTADQAIEMFRRSNEPKKLWVIPGIEHHNVYEEPYLGKIIEATTEWFAEHLGHPNTLP